MQDLELIAKIKSLRSIKPAPEWRAALKSQLFPAATLDFSPKIQPSGTRPHFAWLDVVLGHRLAFAMASAAIIIAGGVLFLSQQAMPGEPLFGVKKTAEQVSLVLTPESEKLRAELLAVKQRLDELEAITKQAEGQKLASAIQEYKNSTFKAAKNIAKSAQATPNKALAQEIVLRTQGLKQREEILEQTLATDISASQELSEAAYILLYKSLAQDLIEKLSQTSLTGSQEAELARAKELFEKSEYQVALETLLLLSQHIQQ